MTRSKLEIWDIKTNCLSPAASHDVESPNFGNTIDYSAENPCKSDDQTKPELTICEFRNCGHSIVVGDESGTTYVFELKYIPSPPHFQYEALEKVLIKNASTELIEKQIKNLGYMGY